MNSDRKEKAKSKLQKFNNKIYHYAFTLLRANLFSIRVYGFLVNLLDLVFLLIFPLETIWTQENVFMQREHFKSLNFILTIGRTSIVPYISDVINGLVLLVLLLLIFTFIMFEPKCLRSLDTSRCLVIRVASVLLTILTKLLMPYLLSIQLLQVRCYFLEGVCYQNTSIVRFAFNMTGMIVLLAMVLGSHFYLYHNFPNLQIVTSQPVNRYQILSILKRLMLVFGVTFQDYLYQRVNHFILLIPVIVLQSMILVIELQQRTSYSQFIDMANIIKDTAVWVCTFYALTIDAANEPFDEALYFVGVLCVIVMSSAIYFMKRDKFKRQLKNYQEAKNEDQAEQNLHSIVLAAIRKDPVAHMQLNLLLQQHTFTCADPECSCSDMQIDVQDTTNIKRETTADASLALKKKQAKKKFKLKNKALPLKDHEQILEIIASKYRKDLRSKNVVYLHIFIKIYYLHHVHTSFFELKKLHRKNKDPKLNEWLKIQILEQAHLQEQSHNAKTFDIDTAIQVEQNFVEFKRLTFETAMLVDMFWVRLAKKDFLMRELLQCGYKIVDGYLEVKQLYEEIMKKQADYKEAVKIFAHFNSDVMNFEIEGNSALNTLKNINQKIRINRFASYNAKKEHMGLILVACNPNKKKKIILANTNFIDISCYKKSTLIDNDMNCLIPLMIQPVHDEIMNNYLSREQHEKYLYPSQRRVWLKKEDENIVPIKIEVQASISEQKGIIVICFVDPTETIEAEHFSCPPDKSYILLTDDQGFIQNTSTNFAKMFLSDSDINLVEDKVNLEEVFVGLTNYTPEDLEKGVTSQINHSFLSRHKQIDVSNPFLINIKLIIKNHKLPFNIIVKEAIFIINEQSEADLAKSDFGMPRSSQNLAIDDEDRPHNRTADLQNEAYDDNGSGSASNSTSSVTQTQYRVKQTIHSNGVPQTLINMKRAILIYFFIVLATSFAILSVTIISKDQFFKDAAAVKDSIQITNHLANMRLSFRVQQSKVRPWIDHYIAASFEELQEIYVSLYDRLTHTYAELLTSKFQKSDKLKSMIEDNTVQFFEIIGDNTVNYYYSSYKLGVQAYITKLAQFTNKDSAQWFEAVGNLTFARRLPYYPQVQKDMMFVVMNGNSNIRDQCLDIANQYMQDSRDRIENFRQIVLIIILVCIAIATVSAAFIIPVMSAFDTEQLAIIHKWFYITEETKQDVIRNIGFFIKTIQNDNHEKETPIKQVQSDQDLEASEFGGISSGSPPTQRFSLSRKRKSIFQAQSDKLRIQDIVIKANDGATVAINNFESTKKKLKEQILRSRTKISTLRQLLPQSTQKEVTFVELSMSKIESDDLSKKSVDESHQDPDSSRVELNKLGPSTGRKDAHHDESFEVEGQEAQELQKNHLKHIFTMNKVKKILLILGFTVAINVFYIVCWFISNNSFTKSSDSFDYIFLSKSRPTCLSESLDFVIENRLQNTTIYVDRGQVSTFDYTSNYCQKVEQDFERLMSDMPPQLESLKSIKTDLASDRICDVVFSNDTVKRDGCKTYQKGILGNGLRNTLQVAYHDLIKEYISFETAPGYIKQVPYLQTDIFVGDTDENFIMLFRYLNPIFDYIGQQMEASIDDFLQKTLKVLIIVFGIFMVFLLVSLTLALKPMMNVLKKQVFRTRILLKIIPEPELYEILKKEKREQKQM